MEHMIAHPLPSLPEEEPPRSPPGIAYRRPPVMAYLRSLQDALVDCRRAHEEAEAALSSEVIHDYRRERVRTLDAWNALLSKYPHDRAIEALQLIAEFGTRVKGLELRIAADARPLNLKLGKMRHMGSGKLRGRE